MNAAGTCKTLADVERLAQTASAAIVVGSITVEPREGNSGNVYHCEESFSVNALGLPNPGLPYYETHLPRMVRVAHDSGKPLIVSVAGFSPKEYCALAMRAYAAEADLVELNLGCPNVWHDGRQKRIASFDMELVASIAELARACLGDGARFTIKLSPFSDPAGLSEVASCPAFQGRTDHRCDGVVCCNTFPNACAVDDAGAPRISTVGGLAGFAGRAYKPIAIGQVRQLRAHLPADMPIIGVGGIWTGADVRDFLVAGASAVQIGTAYLERGPQIFGTILAQLLDATRED